MTLSPPAIPCSAFSTTHYEDWHEAMSVLYTPVIDERSNEGFHARVKSYRIGAGTLNRCASVRQGFERTERQIGRDGLDHYMVQVFRKGRCYVAATDGQIMEQGDICIFDSARPLDTFNEDFDLFAFVVPRYRLAPLLTDPDGVHYGRVPARNPLAKLFRMQLAQIYRLVPVMTTKQAADALSPLIQLLAIAANEGLSPHAGQKTATRYDTLHAIRKHIDLNLASATLDVETIASQFGLSRTGLYRLFKPVGSIGNYVQQRRLTIAYARLADPASPAGSIGAVASAVGFQTESSFIRAFKRRYGMTPGAVRSQAGAIQRARLISPGPIHEKSWSQWLAEL